MLLSISKAKSTLLPSIKEFLVSASLPASDLHPGMDLYYADEAGALIACGGYERFEQIGLLRSVAISQSKQNQGLGTQWVGHLLEKARELQLSDIYLLTTTAQAFFEKLGFAVIAREEAPHAIQESEEFSSLCPSSAVLMHKAL